MCKCQNKPGFKQAISKAKAAEKQTGEDHVVFYMKAVDLFFVSKKSQLNDELGICCYFTTDGTEVKYDPQNDGDADAEGDATDTAKDISNKVFKNFVDNGKVSQQLLNSIAEKVKTQTELTERENAIFVAKTTEINEIIAEDTEK